jgi:hypothetical protein
MLSGCQTGGIPMPVQTSSLGPPISTPLNVAKFKADPCSVVTVEQLEAVGILGGKPLSDQPEHCTFTGLPKPDVFFYVQYEDSMQALYYRHVNGYFVGNHWEELTIKEYPAVIIDVDQRAPDESAGTQACTLNLGADAKTIIAIHVNTYVNDTGRWKDNACGAVKKVTELVIDNLRG